MDRARLIAPSVSLAAHVGGATLLALGLLLLPDRLPAPARGGFDGLAISRSFAVDLAGGAGHARARVGAPRVARAVAPFVAPATVADLVPVPSLEVDGSAGVVGLPDQPGGDGTGVGLCLSNCGGSGIGDGGAPALLPDPEPRSQPVRARQGGLVREPRKLRHVAPVYPRSRSWRGYRARSCSTV